MSNNSVQKQDIHDTRDSPSSNALTIRRRPEDKKSGSKSKFRSKSRDASSNRKIAKDQCSYCKNKGHWKKDCPALKGKGMKPQKTTTTQSDSDESDFSAFTSATFICQMDEWILDYGCTFHMCPHRDWFTTFEQTSSGLVYMENHLQSQGHCHSSVEAA